MTTHSSTLFCRAVLLSLCLLCQIRIAVQTNTDGTTVATSVGTVPQSTANPSNLSTTVSSPTTSKTSTTQTTERTQPSTGTNPDAVTNLIVSIKTISSVYLTWNYTDGSGCKFRVNWTNGNENNSNHTSNTYYNVTGLTAGVNYTFTVTAVSADKQTRGPEIQTSTFTNPDVVTNLTVSNKTTSSVYLTWNNPNGSWSHFIVNWTDGSESNSNNTSAASYNITDLTAGVRYTFTVTAVAGDKQTTGAETQISTFTKPEAVTNLTVSSSTSTVYLTWAPPPGNQFSFIVYWTDGSENKSSDTSAAFYNITGLTAGVNYTFTVTVVARDNQTTGPETQIATFTNPDVVTNLTVSNKTTSSVCLTWNNPNGNWSHFIVNWTDGSESNSNNTSGASCIPDLTAGVNYTFTVSAVAGDNHTRGAETQTSTFTKPNAVTNLTVSNKTSSSVHLTWNNPIGRWSNFIIQWSDSSENNNSHTSTSIVYQTWNTSDGNWPHSIIEETGDSENNTTALSGTSYTVTGLTAGVNYIFTVTAVAGDNKTKGAETRTSTFSNPNVVTNLTVCNKTTSSVYLTWNNPNGSWSHFIVNWTDGSESNSNSTSAASYNITDLTAGVRYTFTVTAVAGDNQTKGAETQTSTFTKPNIVTSVIISNKTTSSVYLTWAEPDGNWSYFLITWTDVSENNINITSSLSYTVTGLNAGMNYTFTVIAAAEDKTIGAATQKSTFTKPNAVTNLTVSNKTTSSVHLTWNEPKGNWSYFIVKWTDGSENNNSSTSNSSYTVNDLDPGVNYTFTVIAVAADGETEGAPTQNFTFTNPDAVTNLIVSTKTISSVYLTWTYPNGNWSYFIVNWTDGSESNRGNTSNAYYNVTGLNAGMNYTFTVTAVAGDQTLGAQTQTSTFTNPDAVTNLIVSAKTTSSVHLTWSNPNGNWSHFIVHRTDGSENNREYTSNAYYDVTGLTAGVNYTFTVTAVAADNQTKGAETQTSTFTKPDVVKNLKVTEITTSSLFVTWTEPRGEKSFFNVQWSNDIITQNSTTTNNSYNITNLSPGGNYTLLISAVAADNRTEGEEVALSLFSKPDIIRNLTSPIVTSTSVFLDWAEPLGSRSFFRVHWANGNVTKTPATDSNITDLIPGTNYSFSVSAVAADNKTEGSLVWLSTCTVASPVSDITCEGPNHTSPALLTLTWTNPPGNNQGFNISLKQSLSELIPTCNVSCSHTFSTNLKYFSPYTVIILTHGCGESGTQEINCRTGITEPPVPSKPEEVKINATAINEHAVQLMFNTSLLNSTNGPIEAYGVVLSTDHESNISTESLRMNYSDWKHEKTKTYLTVLKFNENIKRSSMITVVIGNGSTGISNTAYENGPLSNEKYSIALVLFTYLNITDRLINIQESIFSVTHYSTTKAKPMDPESNVVAVVLGVLLPIIVLLIIAIIVLVMQKRRITKEYTDIPVNNLRTKISIPVRVEDFESYLKKQQLDSNCGFAEQYEDLKIVGTAQPKNSAIAMENKGKNRYNNVLPYDSSRVKLSVHGSPFDDYINANYISGYNSKKEYIAAQGPLPATVNEFWRMIWEQNSHTIVMLTKCYEQGRVKCERYWPPDNKLYNNILVTTTSEIELEDWTIRDFSIKNVKTAETRNVRQFHFTAWPDHGVPETTEVLINFRHLVREHMESFSHNAPTVVHCSAGVGRTGTFIAVDHLIFQIERESMVDIYGIIHGMRMRRPLMVQTEDQYVFLNQCASDIIKSRMGTNVDLIYQNAAAFSIYENLKS